MNRPQRSPEAYRRWAEVTDGPLLGLAVLFLVVLLVPLYQGSLASGERMALRALNVILWVAFGVDYAVRLWLAPDRRTHVRTHVADLLTLAVPFLRPLRLLRVIGLLGTASRRAGERQLLQTTTYVVTGVGVLIVVAAGLVLDVERGARGGNIASAGDALWW
ncbi:MAG: ion transport integral rane protein, partial [Frankiales bacterium]|nr:ion transport integral rane protein [Frankiales bacterium]